MAFTDRVVEHPGRVQLTNVSGDIYDMTRQEGTVYTDGTLLNAANLNEQTQVDSAVESALNTAGMTSGTYDNVMSDALKFLLDGKASTGGVQTSGDWTYIILGGIFFGMYKESRTLTMQTATGSIYTSSSVPAVTLPVTLTKNCFSTCEVVSGSYPIWAAVRSATTSGVSYQPMSSLSRAQETYSVELLVIGTV